MKTQIEIDLSLISDEDLVLELKERGFNNDEIFLEDISLLETDLEESNNKNKELKEVIKNLKSKIKNLETEIESNHFSASFLYDLLLKEKIYELVSKYGEVGLLEKLENI